MDKERILVVSGHAVDYLSKSGGTITQYAMGGSEVLVVCLTCGERGEANSVWKMQPGVDPAAVKETKKQEAQAAADILGVNIEFMELSDHPLMPTREAILALAGIMMDFQPTILITHYFDDASNTDHGVANSITLSALRCAHGYGTIPGKKPCGSVRVFMFEPGKPDLESYRTDTYVDITNVIDIKEQAMACVQTQKYLVEICRERDSYRGGLARRHGEQEQIRFAEGFMRMNPYIGQAFY